MLKTEKNTPEMADRISDAAYASVLGDIHPCGSLGVVFEHGQHWITCVECGAQWSVVDASGGRSVDGFDFEQVSEGDGLCEGE